MKQLHLFYNCIVGTAFVVLFFAGETSAQLKPPVWPFQWNATLAKINPADEHIWWTKFYYDWTKGVSRFDFYNHYYNTSDQWSLNCSILFVDNNIWFDFPSVKGCYLDHTGLPTISPWWLQGAVYKNASFFRGMWCEKWTLEELQIDYIARAGDYIPVRSTNQAEDPGATDYFDVVLGPQDPKLFVLPPYCLTNKVNMPCPPPY